jgi:MerR family transcriptional regulator, redox-sensitive transcriptional activator SoxR
MQHELSIGDLAKRSGVATSALRFYEARGLIHSERMASGHRRYPRATLRRVAFIVFAQKIGLGLDAVAAELTKLPRHEVPSRADWQRLSTTWTNMIDSRIAELQRLRAGLTDCIGCGCLSLAKCRLVNPSDRAARYGPGPFAWSAALNKKNARAKRVTGRKS